MINSFFSCCINFCCSKTLFKSPTLTIQQEEEKSHESKIKKKKIKVEILKLDIFSKHIIEDIISPCEVRLQDFVIEKV